MQDGMNGRGNKILEEISSKLTEILGDSSMVFKKETSFNELGVSSVKLLELLVALENSFGIEWSIDTPQEVFGSPMTLSEYILGELGERI